jgi:hypothetical protein
MIALFIFGWWFLGFVSSIGIWYCDRAFDGKSLKVCPSIIVLAKCVAGGIAGAAVTLAVMMAVFTISMSVIGDKISNFNFNHDGILSKPICDFWKKKK